MRTKTLNIKQIVQSFALIILLLPFIQQRTIEELPESLKFFYSNGIILSSICIYLYLIFSKKIEINAFIIIFIIIGVFYCFNSVYKWPESVLFCAKHFFCMFALIMFVSKIMKKDMKLFIHSLAIIYHFFILANFILLIIFPEGIYETSIVSYHTGHLLGDDNALIYVLLPGIIITCIDSIIKKNKLTYLNIFEIIICEISFIKVWSATSIVCFTLFIFLIIINNIHRIPLNILIIMFVGILFLLLFGLSSTLIQKIIINVLHKSVTLSGRTLVWRDSIELIKYRLFTGYGGYFSFGKFFYNGMFYPCHTPYLQILLDTGIIGLALYILLFGVTFNRIKKNYDNKAMSIMMIGIICIMINYILEYSQFFHLYILLCIAYNFDIINNKSNERSEKL